MNALNQPGQPANLPAFADAALPAHLGGGAPVANAFAAGMGQGFNYLSIKGSKFHVMRGGGATLVADAYGMAAPFVDVIVMAAPPGLSKSYYARTYVEGSNEAPDCHSSNGVSPDPDSRAAQSPQCATCPHNQWGSRVSETGSKGKACTDSMRVVIAPPDVLTDLMLLRVPPFSLKALGNYGDMLAKRGLQPWHVITRISFDPSVAFPSLVFQPASPAPFVTAEQLVMIEDVIANEQPLIQRITSTMEDLNVGAATPEQTGLAARALANIQQPPAQPAQGFAQPAQQPPAFQQQPPAQPAQGFAQPAQQPPAFQQQPPAQPAQGFAQPAQQPPAFQQQPPAQPAQGFAQPAQQPPAFQQQPPAQPAQGFAQPAQQPPAFQQQPPAQVEEKPKTRARKRTPKAQAAPPAQPATPETAAPPAQPATPGATPETAAPDTPEGHDEIAKTLAAWKGEAANPGAQG